MRFDFSRATRIIRAAGSLRLVRRSDDRLPFIGRSVLTGAVLLDTCVYIDRMQDRITPPVRDVLSRNLVNHSSVALQELLHVVGLLDPKDSRSASVIEAVKVVVEAMPSHRIFAPDIDVLAEAAVHAGMLSRMQGYARDDRRRALGDCTLFLHSLKLGLTVLTRNVRDFDLLLQLRPEGRVLFYRN